MMLLFWEVASSDQRLLGLRCPPTGGGVAILRVNNLITGWEKEKAGKKTIEEFEGIQLDIHNWWLYFFYST